MLKTIYWYCAFMITAFLSLPKLNKVKKLSAKGHLKEADDLTYLVTSTWALKQIKNAGATVLVEGKENIPTDRACVFISNHQGNFDTAIFMAHIPTLKGYISKIEIKKIPMIRSWMTYMHCVFMDRSTLRTSGMAILEGVKKIKEGHSLVIFPEGTRSKSDHMGEFKSGSFKLATKSKAPIIPVTINGSYKLMEGNNGKVKSGTVYVTIHPPIETAHLNKAELDTLPSDVKALIASKLPQ